MIKVGSYDKKLRSDGTLNQRGVKNEKQRKKRYGVALLFWTKIIYNIDSITFKFGILCLSIITNPMHVCFSYYYVT